MEIPDAAVDIWVPAAFTGDKPSDKFPLDCWMLWQHRHDDALRGSRTSDATMPPPSTTPVIPTWLH